MNSRRYVVLCVKPPQFGRHDESYRVDNRFTKCHIRFMNDHNRFMNELFRIVNGALRLDIDKVRNYTAFLAEKLEKEGDTITANRLRKMLEENDHQLHPAKTQFSRPQSSLSFSLSLLARGVGHNPDSLADMRRIDGTSWNSKRLDFVTETFQRNAHRLECHSMLDRHKTVNILKDDP